MGTSSPSSSGGPAESTQKSCSSGPDEGVRTAKTQHDATQLTPRENTTPRLLLLIWVMTIVPLGSILAVEQGAGSPVRSLARIDPNTAPWWELTALPRIGPGTAHKIVRYRESTRDALGIGRETPVFTNAADLLRIRGIGPRTLQQIAPHLTFRTRHRTD